MVEKLELPTSNFSTIAEGSRDGLTSARCCNYSYMCSYNGWSYHPKHVEQFTEIYMNIYDIIYLTAIG
jgi:hypothetical protein